jgi:hypothetical protein
MVRVGDGTVVSGYLVRRLTLPIVGSALGKYFATVGTQHAAWTSRLLSAFRTCLRFRHEAEDSRVICDTRMRRAACHAPACGGPRLPDVLLRRPAGARPPSSTTPHASASSLSWPRPSPSRPRPYANRISVDQAARPSVRATGSAGHVRIGYARASTARQSLDTQLDSLQAAGVIRIFCEKISTRATRRPELDKAVHLAQEIRASGAAVTLVVHEHERLGRGLEPRNLGWERWRIPDTNPETLPPCDRTSKAAPAAGSPTISRRISRHNQLRMVSCSRGQHGSEAGWRKQVGDAP